MKRRSFIAGSAVLAAGATGTAGNAYAQAAKPAPAPAPVPAVAGSINSTENVPGAENWNNERSIPPEREKLLRVGGVFGRAQRRGPVHARWNRAGGGRPHARDGRRHEFRHTIRSPR